MLLNYICIIYVGSWITFIYYNYWHSFHWPDLWNDKYSQLLGGRGVMYAILKGKKYISDMGRTKYSESTLCKRNHIFEIFWFLPILLIFTWNVLNFSEKLLILTWKVFLFTKNSKFSWKKLNFHRLFINAHGVYKKLRVLSKICEFKLFPVMQHATCNNYILIFNS